MYTVNNTNFFDFGVDAGDAQLMVEEARTSGFSQLLTPIQFFERYQYQLFVSQLCILGLFIMRMLIPALFLWRAYFSLLVNSPGVKKCCTHKLSKYAVNHCLGRALFRYCNLLRMP